jgi:hypothetical protein
MAIPPFGWFLICAAISGGTLAAERRWKLPRFAAWIIIGAAVLLACMAALALLHPLMMPIGVVGTEGPTRAPEEQEVRERASQFWSRYVEDNSGMFTISDDYSITPEAWQDVAFKTGEGWTLYSYLPGESHWLQLTLHVDKDGRIDNAWEMKLGPDRDKR